LDNLFSFLRRKTDFFVGASPDVIESTVMAVLKKHSDLANKEKIAKEKKLAKEKEEKLKKQQALEKKKKVQYGVVFFSDLTQNLTELFDFPRRKPKLLLPLLLPLPKQPAAPQVRPWKTTVSWK
jgi:hypothetical protein